MRLTLVQKTIIWVTAIFIVICLGLRGYYIEPMSVGGKFIGSQYVTFFYGIRISYSRRLPTIPYRFAEEYKLQLIAAGVIIGLSGLATTKRRKR